MKRVVIYLQGVAERDPGRVPARSALSTARVPTLRRLARAGRCGRLDRAGLGPDAWRPEVLLALLCGVPVERVQGLGLGGVEACGLPDLPPGRFWYRGDFVTLDGEVLRDAGPQNLTETETRGLVDDLEDVCRAHDAVIFLTGSGQVLVGLPIGDTAWPGGVSPWSVKNEERTPPLRASQAERGLATLQAAIRLHLERHEINRVRVDLGENPANAIWLWGGSPCPAPVSDREPRHASGAMWAPTPLARGLAGWLGFTPVPGLPLDEKRSASETLSVARLTEALRDHDVLVVPVELPRSRDLRGAELFARCRYLDLCDRQLLGPLCAVLEAFRPYRIAMLADAVSESGAESADSARLVLLAGEQVVPDSCAEWSEQACIDGGLGSITLGPLLETIWES